MAHNDGQKAAELSRLGIGLIGLGRHGRRYAQHLMEPLDGARLVAVCRRDAVEGLAFAEQHALRFFQDYRDLLAADDVRAVVVVTPPAAAHPICLQAVRAGKPLLIEKPLACTGTEAREMVSVAESSGIPLMTAQTLRYDPTLLALKDKVADVGPPRYLALTCRVEPSHQEKNTMDGFGGRGVLLEIGIHLMDLVRFLTGHEIAEVRCEMERAASEPLDSRAWVSVRTTGHLACMVDVSRVGAGRTGRVEWIGEGGQLVADWVERRLRRLTWRQAVDDWTVAAQPTIAATLAAFVNALQRGAPMPISGRDGLRAVEAIDACYESAETGRWVRVAHSA